MPHLFISDLHLEEGRPDITEAFFGFLKDKTPGADSLYILGDFFEVWLGDDHDTAFNRAIIDALAEVTCPKFLMHGNRDFLMGEDFCQAAGATLLADPSNVTLDGKPVLLMHGDSLCTRDTEYMAVRKMLRDPAFQADFLSKSLEEREAFARGARAQSKEHTRESATDIMDVTPEEVVGAMAEAGVDTLIHGHTHRPDVHHLTVEGTDARRIVLGDWDKQGWYLSVADGEFDLRSFDI
ncbi:MAG: UDP-2,3-diacylglucosamine diphosphatase [Pseudomonadales bacterium]|nr:UDP-2,3-diacylglucosamine diphosphatase [Pseudomonadales bacterium]